MKTSDYCFLFFLLPVALGAQTQVPIDRDCCGNDPEGTVLQIRDAASVEVINARRSASAANGYGRAGAQPLEQEVEIRVPKKASLLNGSEFLLGANGFVIVPKGCTVTPSRGVKVLSKAHRAEEKTARLEILPAQQLSHRPPSSDHRENVEW